MSHSVHDLLNRVAPIYGTIDPIEPTEFGAFVEHIQAFFSKLVRVPRPERMPLA